MKFNDDMMKEANDVAFAKIKDSFDEVVELSAVEHQAFIDAVQSVYDYYIEKGLFTMTELEEIRKAAN
jgi:TRAP-type C4-dicarboxylate transport system substrate-binding protein